MCAAGLVRDFNRTCLPTLAPNQSVSWASAAGGRPGARNAGHLLGPTATGSAPGKKEQSGLNENTTAMLSRMADWPKPPVSARGTQRRAGPGKKETPPHSASRGASGASSNGDTWSRNDSLCAAASY